MLGLFAQRDDALEHPAAEDLHPVGTLARQLEVIDTAECGTWIVVRALSWIRLETLDAAGAAVRATVTAFEVVAEKDTELERELRSRVCDYAAKMPGGDRIAAMARQLDVAMLADAAITSLPCAVEEKARYAAEPHLSVRIAILLSLMERTPPSAPPI